MAQGAGDVKHVACQTSHGGRGNGCDDSGALDRWSDDGGSVPEDELVAAAQRVATRLARHGCRDADDRAHHAVVALLERGDNFEYVDARSLTSWLFARARGATSRADRWLVVGLPREAANDNASLVDELLEHDELRRRVRRFVLDLPVPQREAIVAFLEERDGTRTPRERAALHRALVRLRARFAA